MRRVLGVVLAVVLVSGACGGGGGGGGDDGGGAASSSTCPIGAIAKAGTKPVTITLWHSMTRANEETLTRLTDAFNSSQPDVRVRLVNQTSYDDTLVKYRAALGGGKLPDLVQIQDVDQQLMIDSRSVLPVESCLKADKVDTSDFLARALRYYTVRGTQYGMPFNVSNPILFYNKAAFTKAGLDPAKPPTTLDELRTTSEKIVRSGVNRYGISLKVDPWHLEEWLAMDGQLFANHRNGRDARATEVTFDSASGRRIFKWLSGMANDGLAQATPKGAPDNLLAVANGISAMTLESSASLGTIVQVLGSGQFKDVQLGAAALPGPKAGAGTVMAGAALYLVNKSSPARQEAAWRFVKFLTDTKQMAEWAAGTGYVPIRKSSLDEKVLQDVYAKTPEFKVAYDQLQQGSETDANAGAVIGDFEGVRRAVVAAEQTLFSSRTPPADALKKAAVDADSAIKDYEERVAG